MTTHADLTEQITRPPGWPPSQCRGTLFRVDAEGIAIDDEAPAILDSAQAGEGEPGTDVPIRLFKCHRCKATLVVSGDGDWRRLRNDLGAATVSVPA